MTPRVKQADPNGCVVALGLVALVAVVGGLSQCGKNVGSTQSASAPSYNQMADAIGNSISAQDKPPPEPLNGQSVRLGIDHFRIAMKAEGLSGAMIYSQNCYDALASDFSWRKLDTCGGFDMMTVTALPQDAQPDLEKEITYFADETAAGRYLKAATSAGEPADEADTRLSALQAKIAKLPRAKPSPVATDMSEMPDSNQDNGTVDE